MSETMIDLPGVVILPIITGFGRRTYAAIFSFIAGVKPPMPMLVARFCTSRAIL